MSEVLQEVCRNQSVVVEWQTHLGSMHGRKVTMPKLRVHSFSISLDGYGAGPNQGLSNPVGVGGEGLHQWALSTRTFQRMFGGEGGKTGIDDDFMVRGVDNIGAWILGRNMFGPIRGPWADRSV